MCWKPATHPQRYLQAGCCNVSCNVDLVANNANDASAEDWLRHECVRRGNLGDLVLSLRIDSLHFLTSVDGWELQLSLVRYSCQTPPSSCQTLVTQPRPCTFSRKALEMRLPCRLFPPLSVPQSAEHPMCCPMGARSRPSVIGPRLRFLLSREDCSCRARATPPLQKRAHTVPERGESNLPLTRLSFLLPLSISP